jgi:hypothetical protein
MVLLRLTMGMELNESDEIRLRLLLEACLRRLGVREDVRGGSVCAEATWNGADSSLDDGRDADADAPSSSMRISGAPHPSTSRLGLGMVLDLDQEGLSRSES